MSLFSKSSLISMINLAFGVLQMDALCFRRVLRYARKQKSVTSTLQNIARWYSLQLGSVVRQIRAPCSRSVLALRKRARKRQDDVLQNPDGGAAGDRTPIHTKPRIRLYKLSAFSQALKRFGQMHKRHARFELHLNPRKRRKSVRESTPRMMSLQRLGDSAQDRAAVN